jgi:hypothetical protein
MIGPSNPQTDPQTMNGGLIIMKGLDHARERRRDIFRFTSRALSIGLLSFGVASCDFKVENIASVGEETLEDIAVLPLLLGSAEAALQSGWISQTQAGGLASDEYYWGATCTPLELIDVGIWDVTNIGRGGALNEQWENVSRNTWITNDLHERVTAILGAGAAELAYTGLWRGMMRNIQADMWDPIAIDGGPPITPLAAYQGALPILDLAQTDGAGDSKVLSYILAVKARVKHSIWIETGSTDAAMLAAAVADADAALAQDADFRWEIKFGTASNNPLFGSQSYSPSNQIRRHLDAVTGAEDPRVPFGQFIEIGTLFVTDSIFQQEKYKTRTDPVTLAKWQEMNLIVAESLLESGDLVGGVARLNLNRTAAGLADFPAAADAAELRGWLITERQVEFWAEGGRRWMDQRRFDIPFTRWRSEAFADPRGGTQRRFPLPLSETLRNENF